LPHRTVLVVMAVLVTAIHVFVSLSRGWSEQVRP
jgi:hypothetical protein